MLEIGDGVGAAGTRRGGTGSGDGGGDARERRGACCLGAEASSAVELSYDGAAAAVARAGRSEERRVGKECRN